MIKKFEEYISEGLWKSGVDRAKNNIDRLEESYVTNVKELNEIDQGSDVPFYIADRDTIIDDECEWLSDNLDEYEHYLQKFGWRLPYRDEVLKYITTSLGDQINKERHFVSVTTKGYKKYSDLGITSKETKQKVEFFAQKKDYLNRMHYWLRVRDDDEQMAQLILRPLESQPSNAVTCELCPKSGNVYRRIRLVKDK